MRRTLWFTLCLLPVLALIAACSPTRDDSSVEGFAETLPLAADQPTFVFFYTDG